MTKKQFEQKINYLLSHDKGIRNVIKTACMNAVSTDYAKNRFLKNADDNYRIPKNVLCAVLECLAWEYEPLDKSDMNLKKEIKAHVKFTR